MVSIIKPYLIYLIHILLAPSVHAAPDIIGLLNPDNLRGLLNPDNLRGVADGGSDYAKPELETQSLGSWKIDNPNAGVAAMQLQLMPNDQIVWFDTTSLGPSGLKLPEGVPCPVNPEANNQPDCYAHAIAYCWRTSKYRILTLRGDAWCSSGNLWPNGNLMATGGTFLGDRAIRVVENANPNADFVTRIGALAAVRWYSSNQVLPDGSAVVLGGRDSYSYEIIPPQMEFKQKKFDLPFLQQTTTRGLGPGRPVENNLYPFVYLLPDGNIFVFANNRAIRLTEETWIDSLVDDLLSSGVIMLFHRWFSGIWILPPTK